MHACQARPVQNEGKSLFVLAADGDTEGETKGDRVTITATEYSRGPWDPGACHGGPVSALLVRLAERVGESTAWQLTRITVELLRPVPVDVPLRTWAEIARAGRMVSLVDTGLSTEDGTEVARARVLRIRRAPVALPAGLVQEPAFGPAGAGSVSAVAPWATSGTAYHKDSVDLAFTEGSFDAPGPVAMWCRLRVPLIAGEEPSGPQRVMAAADFSNGVANELDGETMSFINPDLTVHLLRPPVGEWIGARAKCHYGDEGAGMSDTALYDSAGRLGRGVQSILVAPR
jgi:hypothetical protein